MNLLTYNLSIFIPILYLIPLPRLPLGMIRAKFHKIDIVVRRLQMYYQKCKKSAV